MKYKGISANIKFIYLSGKTALQLVVDGLPMHQLTNWKKQYNWLMIININNIYIIIYHMYKGLIPWPYWLLKLRRENPNRFFFNPFRQCDRKLSTPYMPSSADNAERIIAVLISKLSYWSATSCWPLLSAGRSGFFLVAGLVGPSVII